MIDRLEELLEMMGDEDEDEQEDALALGIKRAMVSVPAFAPESETGERTETQSDAPERAEAGTAVFPAGEEGPGAVPRGSAGPLDGRQPQGDGLLGNILDVLRAGTGRTAGTPGPVGPQAAVPAAEAGAAPVKSAEGLEELYRRTAQAVRPAAQGAPAGPIGRTRLAEEPVGTAALTVDELDRAVKRDSRRYDGGMSIF